MMTMLIQSEKHCRPTSLLGDPQPWCPPILQIGVRRFILSNDGSNVCWIGGTEGDPGARLQRASKSFTSASSDLVLCETDQEANISKHDMIIQT